MCGLVLGNREIARTITKATVCLLQMQGNRIVDTSSDAHAGKMLLKKLAVFHLNDI